MDFSPFYKRLKMTSGAAQAQSTRKAATNAKQRQKAHFAIAQSTRRAAKAEQGEKPAQKCAHKSHESKVCLSFGLVILSDSEVSTK